MKKAVNRAWKLLKPTEFVFVIGGAFLIIALYTIVQMSRQNKFNPTVKYEKQLSPETLRQIESIADEIRLGETDSNVRYAERIREASGIGLGLSLYLVGERISRNRTLNLTEVMQEFGKSELLPPNCRVLVPDKLTDYGIVQSSTGIYYIRYSAIPLKIEILSGGTNGLEDGSTFILRVPDTTAAYNKPAQNSAKVTSAGAWATLFEAPDVKDHYIPPAFAPVETFTAMNWQARPLQQTEMTPEKVQQLNEFLQKQQ